jgi:23S rRNA pseudouridine2605 synthase
VHIGGERAHGYVGGHNTADEGRELRRFDHVREDRGRGRGPKKHGGLTVSGEAAAKQLDRKFKIKGPRQPGQKVKRGQGPGQGQGHGHENPAAFKTWYVPEGVDTGPSGHRNPDARGRKPYAGKPGRPGGDQPRGFGGPGSGPRGPGAGPRGPRGPGQGQRGPRPYGHPDSAPSFPSDHANPGFKPYGERPQGQRPGGNRPGAHGPRPAGARPGGPRPGGPRPGGPRGGGRPGGGRGPQGGNR